MKKQIMSRVIPLMTVLAMMFQVATVFAVSKAAPMHTININTASAEEMTALPGIGKSKAEAIVTYRQAHPFKAIAELTEVKGIGPKLLVKLQNFVTVDGSSAALGTAPVSKPVPVAEKK